MSANGQKKTLAKIFLPVINPSHNFSFPGPRINSNRAINQLVSTDAEDWKNLMGVKRKRLTAVVFATIVFTMVGLFVAQALKNIPMKFALTGAPVLGLLISSFEVFYFQAHRGRWLRGMHPLKSNLIYTLILISIFIVVSHVNRLVHGGWRELPLLYEQYSVELPIILLVSLCSVMVLRVVSFIGGKNIFYLLIGKYHRPVWERKIFMFLDINGSTKLVDALGPEKSNLLFGKFMFDASKPIADNGGEIYRYQGDGFVATWNWEVGLTPDGVFQAVDDLYATVEREREEYEKSYGVCPDFRVGIHGGEIITCEEGDIRRNIAFYGDTINIAARMETKAKDAGVDCVVTSDIAKLFDDTTGRFTNLGEESVRGINRTITIYGFNRVLSH
jgi:adenylate cyclase